MVEPPTKALEGLSLSAIKAAAESSLNPEEFEAFSKLHDTLIERRSLDNNKINYEKSDRKRVGMYEVGNTGWPQVIVGRFTIARHDENSVWIQSDNGEGAMFSDELLEENVAEFFDKEF